MIQEGESSQEKQDRFKIESKSIRSVSLGPNRTRAELLARRQHLASVNGHASQLGWSSSSSTTTTNNNNNNEPQQHSIGSDAQHDSFEAEANNNAYSMVSSGNRRRSSRSQQRGFTAEAKLESLSEQLKLHQAATANLPNDLNHLTTSNNHNKLHSQDNSTNLENVYILLAKKDKDLQLAAELGKVLLEKNDELSKVNEQQAEEYSRRLELLEEEKHKLRLRLEQLEADYENRLIDVQSDCRLLEAKLEQQREQSQRREREKSRLIDELGQQSQRLAAELSEATCTEQLLSGQVDQLKERLASRGSDHQHQNVQVEAFKSEIEIISQRKQDLERRLRLATEERQQLSSALEETGQRLLVMESLLSERDLRLRDLENELHELREASSWLSNQLDSMINLNERLASDHQQNQSEHSAQLSDRRSQLIDELRELRLRTRTRTKATQMKLLVDKQQQQQQKWAQKERFLRKHKTRKLLRSATSQASQDEASSEDEHEHAGQNNLELAFDRSEHCLAIYNLLADFQAQLEKRRSELRWQQQQLLAKSATGTSLEVSSSQLSPSSMSNSSQNNNHNNNNNNINNNINNADDSGISAAYDDASSSSAPEDQQLKQLQVDESLAKDPKRWQQMLSEIKLLVEDLPCKSCHTIIGEGQKHEQLSRDFARISDELRRSNEQKLKLSAEQTELQRKLCALEELCATLKSDLESEGKTPDEIVRAAWKRRDEAVARKNACEIALAKSHIENMQLSSQLMEVVQQKSQLAHQVAQFEDDMHYLTQYSVKAKFSWEEQAERLRRDQRQKQLQHQQASVVGGLSLGPLSSLLGNFGTSSSNPTSRPNSGSSKYSASTLININNSENGTFINGGQVQSVDQQAKSSIMRNLTRFWSNNKSTTMSPAETTTPSPTKPLTNSANT